jgi:hypothetical protein
VTQHGTEKRGKHNTPRASATNVVNWEMTRNGTRCQLVTLEVTLASRRKKFSSSSLYKGVTQCWDGTYEATYWRGRQKVRLGNYVSELDAALAYDRMARDIEGAHAKLNFPGPGETSAL